MDDRQKDLSRYRLREAQDSLRVAEHCLREELYKDSINRSYYSAFYAVKAVLALGTVDFKRHKDVLHILISIMLQQEFLKENWGENLQH